MADEKPMPDLSNLLGDVYKRPASAQREVPEWSEDDRLDRAFASWSPGPGPDASSTEREMFVSATRQVEMPPLEPEEAPAAVDHQPQATPTISSSEWSEQLPYSHDDNAVPVDGIPEPEIATPVSHTNWRREDDDVLPGRARFSLQVPALRR